jgi:hypothetical protein
MTTVPTDTVDAVGSYLLSVDDRFDPLTADGSWMIQRVKYWAETRGLGCNDHEASDIVIALVQHAGSEARPSPVDDVAQLRTDVTTLAGVILDLVADSRSFRAHSWQIALSGVADRGRRS